MPQITAEVARALRKPRLRLSLDEVLNRIVTAAQAADFTPIHQDLQPGVIEELTERGFVVEKKGTSYFIRW